MREGVHHFHLLVPISDLNGSLTIVVLECLVGTFVKEQVHHLDVALLDRPVQRGVSVTILVIDAGAYAHKDDRTVHVAVAGSKKKRRVPFVCLGVHRGVVLDERIYHVDVTLHLHRGVERCEANVVGRVLAPPRVFLVFHGGKLVAHRALIGVGAIGLVRSHLEAEAALHIKRVLGLRDPVLDLGTTRDEDPAHL